MTIKMIRAGCTSLKRGKRSGTLLYQIQATVGATLLGDEREPGNLNEKMKINDKTKQIQLTRAVQKDGGEWRKRPE